MSEVPRWTIPAALLWLSGACGAHPCPAAPLPVASPCPSSSQSAQAFEAPAPTSSKLALGAVHACRVDAEGVLRCWGGYRHGAPVDRNTGRPRAIPFPGDVVLSGVEEVSVYFNSSCARMVGGTVQCWGGSGPNAVLSPRVVPGLRDAKQVSVGPYHACAVTVSGRVTCWGANDSGQLGDGTTEPRQKPVDARVPPVVSVAAGRGATCALGRDGTVYCWGRFAPKPGMGPAPINELSHVAQVEVRGHACARTSEGAAYCWGDNDNGQVGDGTNQNRETPVRVQDLSGVKSLVLGDQHTCALLSDGGVRCWGAHSWGQLGNPARGSHIAVPVSVALPPQAIELVAGGSLTCARGREGAVRCWGFGEHCTGVPIQRTPVLLGLLATTSEGDFQLQSTCPMSQRVSANLEEWHRRLSEADTEEKRAALLGLLHLPPVPNDDLANTRSCEHQPRLKKMDVLEAPLTDSRLRDRVVHVAYSICPDGDSESLVDLTQVLHPEGTDAWCALGDERLHATQELWNPAPWAGEPLPRTAPQNYLLSFENVTSDKHQIMVVERQSVIVGAMNTVKEIDTELYEVQGEHVRRIFANSQRASVGTASGHVISALSYEGTAPKRIVVSTEECDGPAEQCKPVRSRASDRYAGGEYVREK